MTRTCRRYNERSSVQTNTVTVMDTKGETYIDALQILETARQHPQHSIHLQIHTTPRKHLEGALPQPRISPLGDTKCLHLQGMPRRPLYIDLFVRSIMVSADLRRTTADGLCKSEYRKSRSMMESAFEDS